MHVKKISSLIVLLSTNVYAEGFSSSVGGDYSTGKYGSSESTNVFYLPFGVAYDSGAFTYRLTIPYIRVTGSGDIVPGGFGGASAGGGSSIGQFGCAGDSRKGAKKLEDNGVAEPLLLRLQLAVLEAAQQPLQRAKEALSQA